MLLSVSSFRRQFRLLLLVLAGLVYVLIRQTAAVPGLGLPKQPGRQNWPQTAQDQMRKRIHEASAATSSWRWWRRHGGEDDGPDQLLMDTSNSTLGFQEIFVVNLPTRTDRRDAMTLSAALTGLHFSFSDGVAGEAIEDRVLPPDAPGQHIASGNKGSWRAHMNVLRSIVERNLATALIVEDDIDWDIRLKTQMASFALAARVFHQPLKGSNYSAAHWHTPPFDSASPPAILEQRPTENPSLREPPLPQMRKGQVRSRARGRGRGMGKQQVWDGTWPTTAPANHDVPLEQALPHELPTVSPFGDGWDVLWLGHCGTEFPEALPTAQSTRLAGRESEDTSGGPAAGAAPAQLPLLRVTLADDSTVVAPSDLRPHPFALPDKLGEQLPPHTRAVHAASGTLCTQAYAVTQQGARKLLYQFGLASFTTGWDLMLRDWCDGRYRQGSGTPRRRGRGGEEIKEKREKNDHEAAKETEAAASIEPAPKCLTVQPPLFSHYLTAKEAGSDIQAPGGGFLHRTGSQYIRLSVQTNLRKLANGAGMEDLTDQWPERND